MTCLDALLLAGSVTGTPAAMALMREVQQREPQAWQEMVTRLAVAPAGRRTLLWALVEQSHTLWAGCRHPLSPELAQQVAALVAVDGLQVDLDSWVAWE